MKLSKKLFLKVSFLSLTTLVLTSLVVACSGNQVVRIPVSLEETEIFKIDWNKIAPKSYFDAEIVRWSDGDTPVVKVTRADPNAEEKVGESLSIRLFGIDTPEIGTPGKQAGPFEQARARDASNYAKKILPPGATVRVAYPTGTRTPSFNRTVGSIFFNKENENDFQNDYANNLLKAGLTFPLNPNLVSSTAVLNPSIIASHLLLAYANSFNYASQERLGLFKEFVAPDDPFSGIEEVYKLRGVPPYSQFQRGTRGSIYSFEEELKELYGSSNTT